MQDRKNSNCLIKFYKESSLLPDPRVAYNGTSAAFDIAASETVTIPAHTDMEVPTGIRISISEDQPYYMMIFLRSSFGFKKDLQCHTGIIDSGYTGPFGVKLFNRTDKPVTIQQGEYFAQVLVLHKPTFTFESLTQEEWEEFAGSQARGDQGFGSSGKTN